jgi:YgiT-type zinc finger domain-containing protein
MSDESSKPQSYPCPECHAGYVSMRHIAYYTWVSGELITVPDFPAWICDMCGMREYDHRALSWLNIILDPETGRKIKPQPPRPQPPKQPPIQPDI